MPYSISFLQVDGTGQVPGCEAHRHRGSCVTHHRESDPHHHIGEEIQEAVGALQVCAGNQAGSEAAIHAMRETFEDPCTEAALLVDASNAFKTLNRKVALLNIQKRCTVVERRHHPGRPSGNGYVCHCNSTSLQQHVTQVCG